MKVGSRAVYSVRIRNNETGEIRKCDFPNFTWGPADEYWWTLGNYSCDCNRAAEFYGRPYADDDYPCGEKAFTAIDAELPDGSIIAIDETGPQSLRRAVLIARGGPPPPPDKVGY